MNNILNNPVITGAIVGSVICLFLFQILILLKIKKILYKISIYIEGISRFFFKVGIKPSVNPLKSSLTNSCQFCKHRLSFIHMSENKGEIEDFYYKCKLRNIEVQLTETCEKFAIDEHYYS